MQITERVEFEGYDGSRLAARFDRPAGPIRAICLFAHCFTCSKDLAAAARIAGALATRGFGVLRFDFTGLGHSEGEFENTNFSSNVADLIRACDWLRDHHRAPALLVGHSLGGAAVLAAAGEIPECTAVVTIGAPAAPQHVEHLLSSDLDRIEAEGSADVELAGRTFRIKRQFVEDIRSQRLADRIGTLRRALLVMHGTFDEVVGLDNATQIFTAAKHPKSFVTLDSADHLLKREEDAVYAADVIASWAERYLPAWEDPDTDHEAPVIVAETNDGRYTQDVVIGPHRMRADEPVRVGGDNLGPTPYELLLAAVGTCTSMTLRMYAERKSIPLERVVVSLAHEKIHARDCADCETEHGRIDLIRRSIRLRGDLTDAQRARLLEIADRCPVHRTLESEVKVETRAE